jgi:hypothetical protein
VINYRILGLDPGGATGWATYSAMRIPGLKAPGEYEYYEQAWTGGTLDDPKHHRVLEDLLGNQHVQGYTIVCERFDDRAQGHHVELVSREYIGVVETFCQERNVPLVMQMPAQAKTFVTDAALKKLDLWTPGHVHRHYRDALKHVLFYLVNKEKRFDLLVKGWK